MLVRALRLIGAAARGWTIAWVVLLLVQGLLPAVTVHLTRWLVDGLVAVDRTSSPWSGIQGVLLPAGLMVVAAILTEVLHSAATWIRTAQAELVHDHLKELIHQKSVSVDLGFYEDPGYHDRLHQVMAEAGSRPVVLLESAGSLVQGMVTLLAMAFILGRYGLWVPAALVASSLPALMVVIAASRRHHRWWEETTALRRRAQYFDTLLTQGAVAAELRVFGLGPHFQRAYQSIRRRLREERLVLTCNEGLLRLGAGLVALLVVGGVLAWMGRRVLLGKATLGDLALFYQAFTNGQTLIRSVLGSVGQVFSSSLFLGNLFAFLNLQPQIDASAPPSRTGPWGKKGLQSGIQFRNVTFRYPGAERAALQNFNLRIPAGKITAIVGPNGAGKSTLLKLLCRFYDPQSGAVEFDGMDLRHLPVEQIRRQMTVLFQVPVGYYDTVAQNIALGDLTRRTDSNAIEEAARAAGAHEFVSSLPGGYDTQLGKLFAEGNELSGGQWQRLAQARAYFRTAPILILDEPTSFMDSWGEAAWFERLRKLTNGGTTILITHRFTVAKRADIIHVMNQGQVVESGSHEELLTLAGLYGQCWQEQVQATSGEAVYRVY
jgi:ATP-binding cassette subfamily B protein